MKIAALGDISLGDQTICFGYGVRSLAEKRGYDFFFNEIRHVLSGYDLVVGNLEAVLAKPLPHEQPTLSTMMNRGVDSGADALKQAGIGLVSLANNHIFEHHTAALDQTIHNLERVGIQHMGSKTKPVYIHEAGGMRVAFLSWSLLPDVYWPKENPGDYYNVTNNIEEILAEVAMIRRDVDSIVLSLHWGNEFIHQPSRQQQIMGRRLIRSGVDVIMGHHPHVLQPLESYKGGLIAYSLGNFIYDDWEEATRSSAILEISLSEKNRYKIFPFIINKRSYVPTPVRDDTTSTQIVDKMMDLRPMEEEEYNNALYKIRQKYRASMLLHFFRNIYRYKIYNLFSLLIWSFKRIVFILKTMEKEKGNPNIVYKGPMK